VDSALWFLLRLRIRGTLRRMGRAVSTIKGALLTVLGLGIFAPHLIAAIVQPHMGTPETLVQIRRFGTLGLLAYCVIILLTSVGEKSIYFSPPEVDFLFPGPFSRRRLLAYKLGGQLLNAALLSVLMGAFAAKNAASPIAAVIGLLLGFCFLQLFSVAVNLTGSTVGAMAHNRSRKFALGALLLAIVAGLVPIGRELMTLEPIQILQRIEQSPAMRVILMPLSWFVQAFSAERVWPDLLKWSACSLAVDLALLGLIFALDAQYYESAAASSAKLYARQQRMRRGGGLGLSLELSRKKGKRVSLPMLPWLRGVGPVAWRQITSAQRDIGRSLLVVFILTMMTLPALFTATSGGQRDPAYLALILEATVLASTFFLSSMIPFDFRSDFDRLAELKALPISAVALSIGQMFTPLVVLTFSQFIVVVVIGVKIGDLTWIFYALGAFALPLNLFQIGLENLFFLLFPSRPLTGGTFDVQAMGRMMLLVFVKLLVIGISLGAAVGLGFLAYFLFGRSAEVGFATTWVLATALSFAPIPLTALAFTRLDVARDVPQ
jgi:hypothetical protein